MQATGDLMSNVGGHGQDYEAIRRAVAHRLYERMAMLSAAIWISGTLLLFIIYAAGNPRPIPAAGMAMTVPLIPAALPWLFYRPLATYLAKRRWRAQCSPEK